MKVCVTGANGYIGYHVVQALLKRKVEVIAWSYTEDRLPKGVEILTGDIFQATTFPKCDALIHLAWRDGFKHNAPSHALDLSSHIAFLRGMMTAGCQQIAVMGSMHEVGYHEGMLTETTPCHPTTLYAIAKHSLRLLLSKLIEAEYPDCVFQWLRAFYIFGDDLHNHSVFTKMLQAEAKRKSEFPFVTGNNAYDFTDVHLLGDMIAATICQQKVTGIIHCCTGKPESLRERAEGFIRENHLRLKLKVGAFPDRPYDSPCLYGDPTKIQAILLGEQP